VFFWVEDHPSPKSHQKETAPEQFEAVAEALKVTVSGAVPEPGVAVAEQVRVQGGGSEMEMEPILEQVLPPTLTVRVHV
jgi:hypothetical protein